MPVPSSRSFLLALLPFALHGLAREIDAALGLVLRAGTVPRGVLTEVVRAAVSAWPAGLGRVAAWTAAGSVAWLLLAAWRRRRTGLALGEALEQEARGFAPLYLRPALTLLALASVAWRPEHPYAFTLPVALTQDWAMGQDAAALAALVAVRARPLHVPAPGGGAVFLIAFLAYALLAPQWAWHWDNHPGNEPKYLRMAVAIGHDLTLDAEGVSAPMEELDVAPAGEALSRAAFSLARESAGMARALLRGPRALSPDEVHATRISRQVIRGKEGGVYYVLAPGPSMALAPTLRIDRAINRARGEAGRLAVSVLAWTALAALLVVALFQLVRDATGRSGLAAAVAFGFALLPPFTFYSFQFYPEMPGALVLAVSFRMLALRPASLWRHPWLFGWMVATLPWLHQKFLLVWIVLVATAGWVAWRESSRSDEDASARRAARRRFFVGLAAPQILSAYFFALYNFAITGSPRPDAVFIAWGWGLTNQRLGQGILGLLLDARYGILPYVPVFALAAAGLVLGGARVFAVALPAALSYYMTVASADNWAGPVCNLGRFFMPVAPLGVALVGVCLDRVGSRRGAASLALTLWAWSAIFALALRQDPVAANDSALLLAKSTFADGNAYIPNLFIRTWAHGAPGLWARIVGWLVAIGLTTLWLRRLGRGEGPGSSSPPRVLAAVTSVVLLGGALLERWPARPGPVFRDALRAADGAVWFVHGAARVREDEAIVGPGRADLLRRAPEAAVGARLLVGGRGVLRVPGRPPLVLRPAGAWVTLPLTPVHTVHGETGREVFFSRVEVAVEDGQAVMRTEAGIAAGSAGREADEGAASGEAEEELTGEGAEEEPTGEGAEEEPAGREAEEESTGGGAEEVSAGREAEVRRGAKEGSTGEWRMRSRQAERRQRRSRPGGEALHETAGERRVNRRAGTDSSQRNRTREDFVE